MVLGLRPQLLLICWVYSIRFGMFLQEPDETYEKIALTYYKNTFPSLFCIPQISNNWGLNPRTIMWGNYHQGRVLWLCDTHTYLALLFCSFRAWYFMVVRECMLLFGAWHLPQLAIISNLWRILPDVRGPWDGSYS